MMRYFWGDGGYGGYGSVCGGGTMMFLWWLVSLGIIALIILGILALLKYLKEK